MNLPFILKQLAENQYQIVTAPFDDEEFIKEQVMNTRSICACRECLVDHGIADKALWDADFKSEHT